MSYMVRVYIIFASKKISLLTQHWQHSKSEYIKPLVAGQIWSPNTPHKNVGAEFVDVLRIDSPKEDYLETFNSKRVKVIF